MRIIGVFEPYFAQLSTTEQTEPMVNLYFRLTRASYFLGAVVVGNFFIIGEFEVGIAVAGVPGLELISDCSVFMAKDKSAILIGCCNNLSSSLGENVLALLSPMVRLIFSNNCLI